MPDAKFFPEEWFSVVRCRSCGLGFVSPRPTYDEMQRYYPQQYYDYFEGEPEFHDRRYGEQARFLEAGLPLRPGRRLLDLGCANGAFPRFMMKRGWEVEGVEVSRAAREIDDFPVYRQEFPAIPVDEPTYDAVTAWAVLEHVHDPLAYFEKANRVLNTGGVFAFHVTNFESLGSRQLFLEDVPRHLYFFTEPCVRSYLASTGLVLERADYSDRIYGMDPRNWLVYTAAFRLRGRSFEWNDACAAAPREGLDRAASVRERVTLALRHPLVALDRLLMPLYARYQIAARKYGVVNYLAVKTE